MNLLKSVKQVRLGRVQKDIGLNTSSFQTLPSLNPNTGFKMQVKTLTGMR